MRPQYIIRNQNMTIIPNEMGIHQMDTKNSQVIDQNQIERQKQQQKEKHLIKLEHPS